MKSGSRTSRRRSRRQEAGYAAVVTALLASVLFLGMAAMGVDTARWYVEVERVQKAADAGTPEPTDIGAPETDAPGAPETSDPGAPESSEPGAPDAGADDAAAR